MVRGYDKQPIYVPNSLFSSCIVVNSARMLNRRIRFTLTLRYDDLPIIQALTQELTNELNARKDLEDGAVARFVDFGESSLDVFVQAFTKTTDWGEMLRIKEEILTMAGQIVKKAGADFAFPTRTMLSP